MNVLRREKFGGIAFKDFSFQLLDQEGYDFLLNEPDSIELANTNKSYSESILKSPIRVYIDLTRNCNLNCITCVNNSGNEISNPLSLEEHKNILENLVKSEVFEIKFSGGEITTFPEWHLILGKSADLGLQFSVNTNGVIGQRKLEILAETNPAEVSISIDGGRDLNRNIRGKWAFDAIEHTLNYLAMKGIRTTINSMLTAKTQEEDIQAILDIGANYCQDISFFPIRPIGRARDQADYHLSINKMGELNILVEKHKEKHALLNVKTNSQNLYSNSIDLETAGRFGLMAGGADGFTRFNIFPDGNMYAGGCVPYVSEESYSSQCLGNVRDFDFGIDEIWHLSDKLWDIRKQSSEYQVRCEGCNEYKTNCSGFTLDMEHYREVYGNNPFCAK
jgi:MoaA/NifB/PqqE/SkfB family radical SAM enzyme